MQILAPLPHARAIIGERLLITYLQFGLISLTIQHLVQADAGEYTCTATNAAGTSSVKATLIVGRRR